MRRRLLLLGGSFTTMLIVFLAYYLVSEKTSFFHRPGSPWTGPATATSLPAGRTEIGASEKLQIVDRDVAGRLRAVYRAERAEKTSPNLYKLTRPSVEYYTEDGGALYLWADEGEFQAEDVAGKPNVQRGELKGNVWIYMERASGRPRRIVEDPQELFRLLTRDADSLPLTRIRTEDIAFNNDRLRMWTDRAVAVFSPEVDLAGEGLTIEWNDRPRELRRLRLRQGEFLAVKGLPEGMNMQQVTTAPAPPAASATMPTTTQAATAPADEPPPAKNIYRLTFLGTQRLVNVDFGESKLHHAQELSLTFEWAAGWRPWNRPSPRPPEPATSSAPAEATAAVEIIAPMPQDSVMATAAATDGASAETQPASAPAETKKNRTMFITWSGPLVIEPVGYTQTPDRNRYVVSAKGDELELADARSQAFCREFTYRNPEQTGYLRGSEEQPVRMQFAEDATAESEAVRFDWQEGWARFVGKGRMTGRGGEVSLAGPGTSAQTQPATQPTTQETPQPNQITWTHYAEARFIPQSPGAAQRRLRIQEAEFDGDVELQNPDGAETVRSSHLHAEMAADAQGRDYVRRAVATGDVTARQKAGHLQAKKQIAIDFEPAPPPGPGEPAGARRFRATRMTAEGDVAGEYLDPKDSQAPPMLLHADRVDSDLVNRRHVLWGAGEDLAHIIRGTESIFGEKLTLDELRRAGSAEGPGRIEFLTTDSLGGKLAKPELAKASWRQSMDFDDGTGFLNIHEGVRLDIGPNLDHIECQTLRLRFVKIPAPAATPGPSSRPAAEPAGLFGRLQDSQRQIDTVIAEKDVVVRSPQYDPDGTLAQRVLLTAEDKLFYYGGPNRIDVEGPGTFSHEDYRPPPPQAAPPPAAVGVLPERIDRPWQVSFQWNDHMTFSRADGTVSIKGEVTMGHRSGKQIAGVRPAFWDTLPEGRRTKLQCDTLLAKFPTPAEKGPGGEPPKTDLRESLQLGELSQVTALGNVRVLDGAVEQTDIRCGMLTYDKTASIFTIFGAPPGQPPAKAILARQIPGQSKEEPMTGERIVYYIKTREAVVEKPFVSGVR